MSGEIAVHEGILTAAVPEVEDEISEKANMVLLDVNGGTQSSGKGCRVVGTAGIQSRVQEAFWTDLQND